tara:strand:+ start:271 stop:408 length:138 start_codon:yes stop_codon:yes gene_type:complete
VYYLLDEKSEDQTQNNLRPRIGLIRKSAEGRGREKKGAIKAGRFF